MSYPSQLGKENMSQNIEHSQYSPARGEGDKVMKLVTMIKDLEEIKGIEPYRKYNRGKSHKKYHKSQVRNLNEKV